MMQPAEYLHGALAMLQSAWFYAEKTRKRHRLGKIYAEEMAKSGVNH